MSIHNRPIPRRNTARQAEYERTFDASKIHESLLAFGKRLDTMPRYPKKDEQTSEPLVHTPVEQLRRNENSVATIREQKADLRKSGRLATRRLTKAELVAKLLEADWVEVAEKLDRCCSKFTVRTCGTHRTKVLPTYRCWQRFCPDCANVLARRAERRFTPVLRQVLREDRSIRPCELTLTVRSSFDAKDCFDRLMKSFRKLKERKLWTDHVKGAIYRVEWTFSKEYGFHFHLHLFLARGTYFTQREISELWHKITGDSMIVDIREVKDIEKSLRHVVKYNFKPIDLHDHSPQHLIDALKAIKGRRLCGAIGVFYGVEVVEKDSDELDEWEQFKELRPGDSCPFCSEVLHDVSMNRRAYERFEFELAGKMLKPVQSSP